ncbi:DUF5615 family PIN-like protein [Ekhidna sp.]|uniref:DUF5615 family PIN-like protein n=1 Tax=Ekhidna sp. TaxID=2608089 RepID=UPI003CCBED12
MKLLFDQNISPKILNRLPKEFSECEQVRFVGLEDATDLEIFEYAKANGFAVVTFDSDFVDLNALRGTPPKIIYLNTGNLTTKSISELILNNLLSIQHHLNSNTDDILELLKAP